MNYEKNGDEHKISSPSFDGIIGKGASFETAMVNFWSFLYENFNMLIKNGELIPKYFKTKEEMSQNNGSGTFQLTPNVALKIMIYQFMTEKQISKKVLKNLISTNIDDLLDTKHHSSIWEFEETFRELGYFLDFNLTPIPNNK